MRAYLHNITVNWNGPITSTIAKQTGMAGTASLFAPETTPAPTIG